MHAYTYNHAAAVAAAAAAAVQARDHAQLFICIIELKTTTIDGKHE